MKKILAAMLFALPLIALPLTADAQGTIAIQPKVTVTAKGHDVRQVLSDIFSQAKKSYVLQPNIQFSLFLSLDDTDFTRALDIVCKQANLAYEIRDGIYFVHKTVMPKLAPTPIVIAPKPATVPQGKLSESVLTKKLTTRIKKGDIRAVFAEFTAQTGVKIDVDTNVPAYKLDAFLMHTSLKYALDKITKAANLTYQFTDHLTIRITEAESTVSLAGN